MVYVEVGLTHGPNYRTLSLLCAHHHGTMITNIGEIHRVDRPWAEKFAWLPCRTLGGRWVWMSHIYHRRVWRYTVFVSEPFSEYGDVFDVLRADMPEDTIEYI